MKSGLIFIFLLASAMDYAQQPEGTNVPVIKASLFLDAKATLGEGALYCKDDSSLYWVDIEQGILYRCKDPFLPCQPYALNKRIGTVVHGKGKEVILAMEDGIYRFHTGTKTLQLICSPEGEKKENRFNDGKCSPAGSLWAGTMSMTGKPYAGALYRIRPDGKYTKMIDSVTTSNGIIWSPDGTRMYYIDTPTSKVVEYHYNKQTDSISDPRVVIRIPPEMGYPDGMTIDSNGKLWIAHWGGYGVYCWDPETGRLLCRVEVAAKNVTSCAFGGEDLSVLFITTARAGNSSEDLDKFPSSGALFVAHPDARGIPSYTFGVTE